MKKEVGLMESQFVLMKKILILKGKRMRQQAKENKNKLGTGFEPVTLRSAISCHTTRPPEQVLRNVTWESRIIYPRSDDLQYNATLE
jgi:hypothetical protein